MSVVSGSIASADLKRREPMSAHTSWRVGGPADVFFKPRSIGDLQQFLRGLPAQTPLYWVGLGSNLLVRDGGVRGVVICTQGLSKRIERVDDTRVRAGAGAPCTALARQCVRWQLGPAAFFAGIPGTVGGALAMNAGAFGGETWDRVDSVATLDRSGVRHDRLAAEFEVGYRSVQGPPDEWFVEALFRFAPDTEASMTELREVRQRRGQTQPMGELSCGSVFRNPPGGFAAELIESAGLKGERIGGAMVSEKHANFIINTGTARARDIEVLIETVAKRVEQATGVALQKEVKIIGEHASQAHETV